MAVYSVHDVPLLTVTAPAREVVIWEERRFVLGDCIQEKSEYSGKPSPALDKALLNDILNFQLSRGERV